jgi:hypothetical protein
MNSPNKVSLRTTIPMFIVKQWGLNSSDQLDWSFSLLDNELIVVVRKVGKVIQGQLLRNETTKQREISKNRKPVLK